LEYVTSGDNVSESYRPETRRGSQMSQWYTDPATTHPISSIADHTPHIPSSNIFYSDSQKQEPEVVPSESENYSLTFEEISTREHRDETQVVAKPQSGLHPDTLTRVYTLTEAIPLSTELSPLQTESSLPSKEYLHGSEVSLLESNGGTLHTEQPIFSDTARAAIKSKFLTIESNSYTVNPKEVQIQQAIKSDNTYKLEFPKETNLPTGKTYISHPQGRNWKPSTVINYSERLLSNFEPYLSKAEIEGRLPFHQESEINVLQERDDHNKSKLTEEPELLNLEKYDAYKRDNHRDSEYKTKPEELHSSYLEPNVPKEVVNLNAKNIPYILEPDAAPEIKENQIQQCHIISSLVHYKDPAYNKVKRPPNVQSVVYPVKLTNAMLREMLLNQRPLPVPEFSEISLPQELPDITFSEGSDGHIVESNLQPRELVSYPLSDKVLGFFTRCGGKPSVSDALDAVSSNKNIDRLKVVEAHRDDREISGSDVNNSGTFKTTESISVDKKPQKLQTSEHYNTIWINKHTNDTSDNSGGNELKKLVKFGTSKLLGLIEGLGSIFGFDSVKLAGEISGPGKSLVRESPEEWTLNGAGDVELSRGKNVPRRQTSNKHTESEEEKSSSDNKYALQPRFLYGLPNSGAGAE
jgi:hypothetical protein